MPIRREIPQIMHRDRNRATMLRALHDGLVHIRGEDFRKNRDEIKMHSTKVIIRQHYRIRQYHHTERQNHTIVWFLSKLAPLVLVMRAEEKCMPTLYGNVIDHFVQALATDFLAFLTLRTAARRSFGFVDLEIHARIVASADHTQKRTQRFCRRTFPTDDHAHIRRIHIQRNKHTHLINPTLHLHIVRIINEHFDDGLNKLYIPLFLLCHGSNSDNRLEKMKIGTTVGRHIRHTQPFTLIPYNFFKKVSTIFARVHAGETEKAATHPSTCAKMFLEKPRPDQNTSENKRSEHDGYEILHNTLTLALRVDPCHGFSIFFTDFFDILKLAFQIYLYSPTSAPVIFSYSKYKKTTTRETTSLEW